MSHTQQSLFQVDEPSPSTDKCSLLKDAVQAAIHEMETAERLVGDRLWALKDCLDSTKFTEASNVIINIATLTSDLRRKLEISTGCQEVS